MKSVVLGTSAEYRLGIAILVNQRNLLLPFLMHRGATPTPRHRTNGVRISDGAKVQSVSASSILFLKNIFILYHSEDFALIQAQKIPLLYRHDKRFGAAKVNKKFVRCKET